MEKEEEDEKQEKIKIKQLTCSKLWRCQDVALPRPRVLREMHCLGNKHTTSLIHKVINKERGREWKRTRRGERGGEGKGMRRDSYLWVCRRTTLQGHRGLQGCPTSSICLLLSGQCSRWSEEDEEEEDKEKRRNRRGYNTIQVKDQRWYLPPTCLLLSPEGKRKFQKKRNNDNKKNMIKMIEKGYVANRKTGDKECRANKRC